ncbi:MAG: hypothetical protein EPN82_13135 [Bacteroidetes bacterium]|nr:MAG: hypothetical protein EPN82_13135 [Bacteroidota bacterium]
MADVKIFSTTKIIKVKIIPSGIFNAGYTITLWPNRPSLEPIFKFTGNIFDDIPDECNLPTPFSNYNGLSLVVKVIYNKKGSTLDPKCKITLQVFQDDNPPFEDFRELTRISEEDNEINFVIDFTNEVAI